MTSMLASAYLGIDDHDYAYLLAVDARGDG